MSLLLKVHQPRIHVKTGLLLTWIRGYFKSNSSSRETCCWYTLFMCLDLPIGQNLNFPSVCVQRAKRPPKLMDLILKESSRKKSKAEGLQDSLLWVVNSSLHRKCLKLIHIQMPMNQKKRRKKLGWSACWDDRTTSKIEETKSMHQTALK